MISEGIKGSVSVCMIHIPARIFDVNMLFNQAFDRSCLWRETLDLDKAGGRRDSKIGKKERGEGQEDQERKVERRTSSSQHFELDHKSIVFGICMISKWYSSFCLAFILTTAIYSFQFIS